MSRFTTKIKNKQTNNHISICILSAGSGSKIKSYEPRSLLKFCNKHIIDIQIELLESHFNHPEIITVIGCHANKLIKKLKNKTRIVENQLHEETNSSESLRIGFNNSINENFMFIHGDIVFNEAMLKVPYDKSFIIVDSKGMIKENEVGVTKIDTKMSIMSYGLSLKWGQVAFFTGKEYKLLCNIMNKFEPKDKKKLSFEIMNDVVNLGGSFECYEPKEMSLVEIDRIKDIK